MCLTYRGCGFAPSDRQVIEVGAGNGLNFPHYPASVREVVAVEPEDHLRKIAQEAAVAAPVPVTVVDGIAEQPPSADAEFNAGVASRPSCRTYWRGAAP